MNREDDIEVKKNFKKELIKKDENGEIFEIREGEYEVDKKGNVEVKNINIYKDKKEIEGYMKDKEKVE